MRLELYPRLSHDMVNVQKMLMCKHIHIPCRRVFLFDPPPKIKTNTVKFNVRNNFHISNINTKFPRLR